MIKEYVVRDDKNSRIKKMIKVNPLLFIIFIFYLILKVEDEILIIYLI